MAVEAKQQTEKELALFAREATSLVVRGSLLRGALEHIAWLEQGGLSMIRRRACEAKQKLKVQQPVVEAAVARATAEQCEFAPEELSYEEKEGYWCEACPCCPEKTALHGRLIAAVAVYQEPTKGGGGGG